jgi:hypothetical protein
MFCAFKLYRYILILLYIGILRNCVKYSMLAWAKELSILLRSWIGFLGAFSNASGKCVGWEGNLVPGSHVSGLGHAGKETTMI